MNKCRDCRFFTGKTCEITGYNRVATFGCVHFSSNISSTIVDFIMEKFVV